MSNLSVEIEGLRQPDEIILLGAHYDSEGEECPGANDNASGEAALLELSRELKKTKPSKTIRFVGCDQSLSWSYAASRSLIQYSSP